MHLKVKKITSSQFTCHFGDAGSKLIKKTYI